MDSKQIIFFIISGCIASIFFNLTLYIKKKKAKKRQLDRKHKQDIQWATKEAHRRTY